MHHKTKIAKFKTNCRLTLSQEFSFNHGVSVSNGLLKNEAEDPIICPQSSESRVAVGASTSCISNVERCWEVEGGRLVLTRYKRRKVWGRRCRTSHARARREQPVSSSGTVDKLEKIAASGRRTCYASPVTRRRRDGRKDRQEWLQLASVLGKARRGHIRRADEGAGQMLRRIIDRRDRQTTRDGERCHVAVVSMRQGRGRGRVSDAARIRFVVETWQRAV